MLFEYSRLPYLQELLWFCNRDNKGKGNDKIIKSVESTVIPDKSVTHVVRAMRDGSSVVAWTQSP